MPPGRPRRMRYTFTDVAHRQHQQQPVFAWEKVWTTPSSAATAVSVEDDEDESGEAAAAAAAAVPSSYKILKWRKIINRIRDFMYVAGQTIVHEDDDEEEEDDNDKQATASTPQSASAITESKPPLDKDVSLEVKANPEAAVEAAAAAVSDVAATLHTEQVNNSSSNGVSTPATIETPK